MNFQNKKGFFRGVCCEKSGEKHFWPRACNSRISKKEICFCLILFVFYHQDAKLKTPLEKKYCVNFWISLEVWFITEVIIYKYIRILFDTFTKRHHS